MAVFPAAAFLRELLQPAHHGRGVAGFPPALSFGRDFCQSTTQATWPSFLRKLSFEALYRPIMGVVWPTSIRELEFMYFYRPIDGVAWPDSLQKLSFGS